MTQLVINFIYYKTCASKNIMDLMKDVGILIFSAKDIKMEYYNKLINRDTDIMIKHISLVSFNVLFMYLFLCSDTKIFFFS